MSNYDSDGKKQVPGALPDNAYDRVQSINPNTGWHKTPNGVYVGSLGNQISYFFGTSASYASLDRNLTGGEADTVTGYGQITCSEDSKQISGSDTAFTTELKAGDKITITSESVSQTRVIDTIKNDVSMSVTSAVTLLNMIGGIGFTGSLVARKRTFNSSTYQSYGIPDAGTFHLIHPTAVSGSSVDDGKVFYVYKSGFAGTPRG